MKAASRVIHVGDFGVLRDSTISRFVSSGSCVMHVGDFTPQIDFRVYALPMRDRFGIPFPVRTTANQAAKKRANKTRMATPTSFFFSSMPPRNSNINPAFNAAPR
jgi:hypothetical protein